MADTADPEAGQRQTQTNGAVAQEGSRSLQQDALNRVRALTGGIMIMACPVLLSIAVNKVNPKTAARNNKLALGIVWMAALTLEAGICPFVTLCLSNATSNICPRISGHLFVASKLLVHLCALLLMALAYAILLLISKDYFLYVCLMIAFALPTLFLCYLSVQSSPANNSQATATAQQRNNSQVTPATAAPTNSSPATTATADQTTNNSQVQVTVTDDDKNDDTSESDGDGDGDQQKQQVKMLENLVEFSVAGTSMLFLGLEGLALQRLQSSSATATVTTTVTQLVEASLVLSFITCLMGVLVMLPGVVPPPQLMKGVDGDRFTNFVEILNIVLAIFIGMTVILIASATVKVLAWLLLVPVLVSLLLWMFFEIISGDASGGGQVTDVKPASLDLTKVTFTGFLAVSVMNIGKNAGNQHHTISFYEHAFILLTSSAVVAGIGWRLLTHRTELSRALAVAANAASVCAHTCVALAVVPFAIMAFKRG